MSSILPFEVITELRSADLNPHDMSLSLMYFHYKFISKELYAEMREVLLNCFKDAVEKQDRYPKYLTGLFILIGSLNFKYLEENAKEFLEYVKLGVKSDDQETAEMAIMCFENWELDLDSLDPPIDLISLISPSNQSSWVAKYAESVMCESRVRTKFKSM
jgi:hypothetical protein